MSKGDQIIGLLTIYKKGYVGIKSFLICGNRRGREARSVVTRLQRLGAI